MNGRYPILLLLCLSVFWLRGQKIIRGTIVEKDSITAMPFAYIINKSNGNGTMSDNDGKFTLSTNDDDTLVCSYIGYARLFVPVRKLRADNKGLVNIVMNQMSFNLSEVTVSTFKIKP